MKKILLPVVALSLMLSQQVYAQEGDADQKARTEAATELLKASPPQSLVDQMMGNLSKNPRMQFTDAEIKDLKAGIDYVPLEKAMKSALVTRFTVDELKMMTQMYGSPVGQSIIQKMPDYMAEIMPALTGQIQTKVVEAMKKKMEQQKAADVLGGSTPAMPPADASAPASPAVAPPAAAPAETAPATAPSAPAQPAPAPAKE